jgi:hypothetical protein
MDMGTRAFNSCFSVLKREHTGGHFSHSAGAQKVFSLYGKRNDHKYLFALLVPYTFTAYYAERFK